jgi:hypothetical protein
VASRLCFELANPVRQRVDKIQQGDDQCPQLGVLGSWVLLQHLGGEGVKLNSHRRRVLRRRARSVVDLHAVRANSRQGRGAES